MKLGLLIFNIVSSQLLNTVRLPIRPIYISKQIEQAHTDAIHWAMSEYNRYATLWDGNMFFEVQDKNINHIRIQYEEYNGCSMSAVSMSEGYFLVSETVICFQRELDPIMTQCVILHELGHALGLGHTDNATTSIMHQILPLQSYDACTLKKRDLINLFDIFNNGY